jgi:hypothetical protein
VVFFDPVRTLAGHTRLGLDIGPPPTHPQGERVVGGAVPRVVLAVLIGTCLGAGASLVGAGSLRSHAGTWDDRRIQRHREEPE